LSTETPLEEKKRAFSAKAIGEHKNTTSKKTGKQNVFFGRNFN
jgi:hypothetical protein